MSNLLNEFVAVDTQMRTILFSATFLFALGMGAAVASPHPSTDGCRTASRTGEIVRAGETCPPDSVWRSKLRAAAVPFVVESPLARVGTPVADELQVDDILIVSVTLAALLGVGVGMIGAKRKS